MRYLKTFESYSNQNNILIIVDVQKSFKEFFTDKYVEEIKKYCNNFSKVYQIFDNHVDGDNVDKDYLYDDDHEVDYHKDLYNFPNEIDVIEKRYNYDVDADFYKNILDEQTYNRVKKLEKENKLKIGDYFETSEGTIIVYINNNHCWFHCPKKLYDIFKEIVEAQDDNKSEIIIIGGAKNECILDVEICAKSLGVKLTANNDYIYSATNCPIK